MGKQKKVVFKVLSLMLVLVVGFCSTSIQALAEDIEADLEEPNINLTESVENETEEDTLQTETEAIESSTGGTNEVETQSATGAVEENTSQTESTITETQNENEMLKSDIAPAAVGLYNTGDIAVINNLLTNNWVDDGSRPALAPSDGSSIPYWWFVTWSSDINNKRVTGLMISDLRPRLVGTLAISELSELTSLNCSENELTGLDVAGLSKLTSINCSINNLQELNLSGCSSLESILCGSNQLTELIVNDFNMLKTLICDSNYITELDVSNLSMIKRLECENNRLKELKITNCISLEILNCYNNQLPELNASGLSALESLSCFSNKLRNINVNGLNRLEEFACSHNLLTELDVSGLTVLEYLNCSNNLLTGLDITGLFSLYRVNCSYNNMQSKSDVSGKQPWNWDGYYYVFDPQSSSVVPNLYNKSDIAVINNIIETNWTNNSAKPELAPADGSTVPNEWTFAIWTFDGNENRIRSLDLKSKSMTGVLDVSKLTTLEWLDCSSNQFTGIDVTGLTLLTFLNCHYNNMKNQNDVKGFTGTWDEISFFVFNPQNNIPTITTKVEDIPTGIIDFDYSFKLDALSDTPIVWSVINGNLPDGLNLLPNGEITGIPTKEGIFNFSVVAKNAEGSATALFSITVSNTLTLEDLMAKFPNGRFWNHPAPAPGEKYTVEQLIAFSETTTTQACVGGHSRDTTCNALYINGKYVASQCLGFTYKLQYDLYGENPSEWKEIENLSILNNLKPGDHLRGIGHSIFIVSVEKDENGNAAYVTFADCNGWDGIPNSKQKCQIQWGGVLSKNELLKYNGAFDYVKRSPDSVDIGTISNLNSHRIYVKCPVDIEIYNEIGTLVGRVIDNVVDYSIPVEYAVSIVVENDDKIITLPTIGEYTLKTTGTDDGTMDFNITSIDLASFDLGETKEFTNITLEKDKEFTLTISSDDIVSEAELFVVGGNGIPIAVVETNGTETPINNDSDNSTGSGNNTSIGNNQSSTDNNRSSISYGNSDDDDDDASEGTYTRLSINPLDNLVGRVKTAVEAKAKVTPVNTPVIATVQVKGADKITLSMLKQAAISAKEAGGNVVLHFDIMNKDGKKVVTRLYIKPELAKRDIILTVDEVRQSTTKTLFEKYFKNKIAVVSLNQQEDFGMPVEIASSVYLNGMDSRNLFFYSYDKTKNQYRRIENPQYWLDTNGYLHFTTEYGKDIVISEGLLSKTL